MNDFTKEELQIILEGILWRDATILPCDRPEKLKGKIQSMIDGYCEHRWAVYISSNGNDVKCQSCNKSIWA